MGDHVGAAKSRDELATRTLSVDVGQELAHHMVDYCRRTGTSMSTAVSEALARFLLSQSPAE